MATKQTIRTKNRNYYRKECKRENEIALRYFKAGSKNNANIHLKNSYYAYDQYVYNGGRLKFSQVTK